MVTGVQPDAMRRQRIESLPGLQSNGCRAGPRRSPPGRKEIQERELHGGREGEKSGLPVAS